MHGGHIGRDLRDKYREKRKPRATSRPPLRTLYNYVSLFFEKKTPLTRDSCHLRTENIIHLKCHVPICFIKRTFTLSFLLYQPITTSNKADKAHSSAIFFRATITMASDPLSRNERSEEENFFFS